MSEQSATVSSPAQVNRKRILKNTVMLYLRLLISMGISLYASRVVLNQLGVSDFGIYGLVGGLITLFSFINSSLSSATSRFLTVALAKGNPIECQQTFRSALIAHIIIAGIVLLLAETIGLWLVSTQLNIQADRMFAAQVVYQFSIVSSLISITQVPYNAVLIAHERMDINAWVDICSALMKLGAALMLFFHWFDSLIVYAALIFAAYFLTAVTYRIICVHKFPEAKFKWEWNRNLGRPLLSFSGWNMYAQFCFVVRQQGTNVLLNVFGGTVVNAAAGLAQSIYGMIDQVSTNLLLAARPQLISQYVLKNYKETMKLLTEINLMANFLSLMVTIPFVADAQYILTLWLKNVPPYLCSFSILALVTGFMNLNNNLIATCIHASGKIKIVSVITGTLSLLNLPILWIVFLCGGNMIWAYVIHILTVPCGYLVNSLYLHSLVPSFKYMRYIIEIASRTILIAVLPILTIILLHQFMGPSFFRVVISVCLSVSLCLLGAVCYGLPRESRNKVRIMILSKVKSMIPSKLCINRKRSNLNTLI